MRSIYPITVFLAFATTSAQAHAVAPVWLWAAPGDAAPQIMGAQQALPTGVDPYRFDGTWTVPASPSYDTQIDGFYIAANMSTVNAAGHVVIHYLVPVCWFDQVWDGAAWIGVVDAWSCAAWHESYDVTTNTTLASEHSAPFVPRLGEGLTLEVLLHDHVVPASMTYQVSVTDTTRGITSQQDFFLDVTGGVDLPGLPAVYQWAQTGTGAQSCADLAGATLHTVTMQTYPQNRNVGQANPTDLVWNPGNPTISQSLGAACGSTGVARIQALHSFRFAF